MNGAEPLAQVQQLSGENAEREDIELGSLGERISDQPLKTESSGCLNFLKKKWKKFTETRSNHYDDLDSLERYYMMDCLKLIRILSIDLFQTSIVIKLIYCMIVITCGAVVFQLYEMDSIEDLIKYSSSFVSTIYAILTYVEILVVCNMTHEFQSSIKLWAEDSCGEATFKNIKKNLLYIKIYGAVHAVVGVANAVLFVYPREQDRHNFLIFRFLEDCFPNYKNILGFPCRVVMAVDLYAMVTLGLHFIYITQHIRIQVYLFNATLKEMTQNFDENDEHLFYKKEFQTQMQTRIHFCVNRHIEIIQMAKWLNQRSGVLVVMFSIVGCVLGISIILLAFKGTVYYNYLQIVMSSVTFFSTIAAVVISSQSLQDESEKMTNIIFSLPWYLWNHSNQVDLLIFITNTKKPIKHQFSNNFAVDYNLALSIVKGMYSVVSVIIKLK